MSIPSMPFTPRDHLPLAETSSTITAITAPDSLRTPFLLDDCEDPDPTSSEHPEHLFYGYNTEFNDLYDSHDSHHSRHSGHDNDSIDHIDHIDTHEDGHSLSVQESIQQAEHYNSLGLYYYHGSSDLKSSLYYYKEALKIYVWTNNRHNRNGRSGLRVSSNHAAEPEAKDRKEAKERKERTVKMALILGAIGNVLREMNDFVRSAVAYKECLDLFLQGLVERGVDGEEVLLKLWEVEDRFRLLAAASGSAGANGSYGEREAEYQEQILQVLREVDRDLIGETLACHPGYRSVVRGISVLLRELPLMEFVTSNAASSRRRRRRPPSNKALPCPLPVSMSVEESAGVGESMAAREQEDSSLSFLNCSASFEFMNNRGNRGTSSLVSFSSNGSSTNSKASAAAPPVLCPSLMESPKSVMDMDGMILGSGRKNILSQEKNGMHSVHGSDGISSISTSGSMSLSGHGVTSSQGKGMGAMSSMSNRRRTNIIPTILLEEPQHHHDHHGDGGVGSFFGGGGASYAGYASYDGYDGYNDVGAFSQSQDLKSAEMALRLALKRFPGVSSILG